MLCNLAVEHLDEYNVTQAIHIKMEFTVNYEEQIKNVEGFGVIFCKEGGEVHKGAGIREHLDGIPGPGNSIWVALGPLDSSLPDETKELVPDALKWAASINYETQI